MELRVLQYFLSVAREENFTHAAEQLHVTQPTLSRQIADLEAELGVKLFTRSSHNIVLTEDGILLKRRAQEILSLADKTKQDFLSKGESLEGSVAIGCGEFLSGAVLADCVAAFRQKYPKVHFALYSGNAENIRDNIERGLLDMGLMADPIDIRKYEFCALPVKESWSVLVRADSPLAAKGSVSPRDLVGYPVLLPANPLAEGKTRKWLGAVLPDITVIAQGNLLYNMALLARSSHAAVLTMQLHYHFDELCFVPLSPPLESTTALAWKKEQVFSSAASAFLAFAKKYIAGISDDAV